MPIEKPIIPTFSLHERDRRWRLVRAEMKQAGLDALIALPNQGHWDQFGADIRYLTEIGGFQTGVAAVFPVEGEVTAGGGGGHAKEGGGRGAGGGGGIPPAGGVSRAPGRGALGKG